jgi:BirA family biotin operon repressor/biotin-[acetyl-CoA-carboxylase] ligase
MVVIAGMQTKGRGRLKRSWLTPQGNLSFSVILKPPLVYLPELIMISSLSVSKAIENVTGIRSSIKWPNDVLIKGKKVCGILIENEIRAHDVAYSVTGIGINVGFDPCLYPDIAHLACGLVLEAGKEITPAEVCCEVLNEMEKLYTTALSGVPLHTKWQSYMDTIGKPIRIKSGNTVTAGTAEAVGEDGTLLLRLLNGELEHIAVGDVTVIKE